MALITGAARAQGRAHALTLARNGADVVLMDICHDVDGLRYPMASRTELEHTAEQVKALGRRVVWHEADVRRQEQIDAVVTEGLAEFGHIDIAIANAAVFHAGLSWELTEEQWSTVIETNLGGVWRTAKAVIPAMIRDGGGSIVMISSVNGLTPAADHSHYAASKHGVIGLMKTMALETAPHGIRCNAICPGFVRSGMTTFQDQLDKYAGKPGGTEADLEHAGRSYHPTRGLTHLDPQHIADAALWLVSDNAAAVTGIAVPVEAGHMLMPGRYEQS
ncbi:mycofactocin-coupled SDR family oxidoreductase [Actinomadura sp. LOL_016]|uniref:mycofactocin-coupled SDR family oxidoreductase n=1 Tax=unclassified Actinomadura TaxID=2626254 RepID=UPI003A8052E9